MGTGYGGAKRVLADTVTGGGRQTAGRPSYMSFLMRVKSICFHGHLAYTKKVSNDHE